MSQRGKPEVSNLEPESLIKEEVLGLQVPVGVSFEETVLEGKEDLLGEEPGDLLAEVVGLGDIVKELPIGSDLKD